MKTSVIDISFGSYQCFLILTSRFWVVCGRVRGWNVQRRDTLRTWLAWQHDNMTTWQHDNMTAWQHDSMTAWQHDNMTTWQHDNMTTCWPTPLCLWQQVLGTKQHGTRLRTIPTPWPGLCDNGLVNMRGAGGQVIWQHCTDMTRSSEQHDPYMQFNKCWPALGTAQGPSVSAPKGTVSKGTVVIRSKLKWALFFICTVRELLGHTLYCDIIFILVDYNLYFYIYLWGID